MSQSSQSVSDWQPGAKKAVETLSDMLGGGRSFSGRERNCCFLNTGYGQSAGNRFADISALSGLDFPDDGRAVALVDWDQDGDVDLWVSNRNAPRLRLLRNGCSWLGSRMMLSTGPQEH